jgi:hypothetical protein
MHELMWQRSSRLFVAPIQLILHRIAPRNSPSPAKATALPGGQGNHRHKPPEWAVLFDTDLRGL